MSESIRKSKVTDIYKLSLHEHMYLKPIKSRLIDRIVTRVPGGWIYTCIYIDDISTVFVPFNNEFLGDYNVTI